ncbi:MAG: 50S ribosomal protein L27 [Candidatus Nealsonbacteria bacterium]
MATTKATGVTRLGRDSLPKYLGIKLQDGQIAGPGQVLVRQRGTKIIAGKNVRRAGDDTLYAAIKGVVKFSTKRKQRFDNSKRLVKIISLEPIKEKKGA